MNEWLHNSDRPPNTELPFVGLEKKHVERYDLFLVNNNRRSKIHSAQMRRDIRDLKNQLAEVGSEVDLVSNHRDARDKFVRLIQDWKSETMFLSSTSAIAMNVHYQRVIGMGELALPFIFEEMREKTAHWFWALQAITGKNPVKKNHRGNVPAMTGDWLDWARENGF